MKTILFPLYIIAFFSCQNSKGIVYNKTDKALPYIVNTTNKEVQETVDDSTFVNIKEHSTEFAFDMKYATTDNFLKANVYGCAECYLRLKTVKALIAANTAFLKQGYRIKLFDCYRPLTIQKKMWAIVNNPSYVADPAKGSIHNRGGAVDLTLIDSNGNELDMGTPFDFFGRKASHSFTKLPHEVIANRLLLKKVMAENGFQPLDSEWWHYNLNGSARDKVSDFKWECN